MNSKIKTRTSPSANAPCSIADGMEAGLARAGKLLSAVEIQDNSEEL